MSYTLEEKTGKNPHHRKQGILNQINVPELGLSFYRNDVYDSSVQVYGNKGYLETIHTGQATATHFRDAVRRFCDQYGKDRGLTPWSRSRRGS